MAQEIAQEIYDSSILRLRTQCCALSQLSIREDQTLEEIKEVIEKLKEKAKTEMTYVERQNFGTHERAVFVITLDYEENLVENLAKLGFEMIYEFHRRNCYPEDSMLKMWVLSW